jgi:anaerobic dimethyl sulfoxide reductase subunit B (iron-sulfur subunit)
MPAGSFVFDANRCTGCGACRVACTLENRLPPAVSWRRIDTFNARRHPAAPVFHLSIACNHCATAACMQACPALAYRRDRRTEAVLIDSSRCIGCGYCAWACP